MNQRMFWEGHCQVGLNPSGSQRDVVGIPSRIQVKKRIHTFKDMERWHGQVWFNHGDGNNFRGIPSRKRRDAKHL